MDANRLFTSALGLQSPCQVSAIRLAPEPGEIHFELISAAKRLGCAACGWMDQLLHDRVRRTWQQAHFFQYQAYLQCRSAAGEARALR